MKTHLIIISICLLMSACSTVGGSKSDQSYGKSPCACYDGYEIFNGVIYKTAEV